MKKGIIVFSIAASILVITFISNNVHSRKNLNDDLKNDNYVYETDKDGKTILSFTTYLDLAYDLTDSKVLTDAFEYIALIKIDSIDGVDNYDTVINQYVHPYTYGKATVLKVLKGNINQEKIGFRRLGGKISFEKWLEGDDAPEKIIKIREEYGLKNVKNEDIIVNSTMGDDIEVEKGKIYLAFLEYDTSLNKENEYWIGGVQYGLREVQQSDVSSNSNGNVGNLKVKDNTTGNWINLSDVVNFNSIK